MRRIGSSVLVLSVIVWLATACGQDPEPSSNCAAGALECDGQCVDPKTDRDHCGGCGNSCGEGVCIDGECLSGCPAGLSECAGTCVDTTTDPAHCGGCGNACEEGRVCEEGSCACPQGSIECEGACVDPQTDPAHCGACGNACEEKHACVDGECVLSCPQDELDCDGTCVDPDTDPAHCGGCDRACFEGQLCVDGECVCPTGLSACEGACVDTSSSVEHCGGCGNSCWPDQLCVDGECVCPEGLSPCDGACVDTSSSVQHCGGCGNSCFPDQLCMEGECICPEGLTPCDGACVDTSSSVEHCGSCGNTCLATQICVEGACNCPAETLLCTDECVDIDSDARHCGGCDQGCPQRANAEPPSCEGGSCVMTCLEGYADCDADETTGCEAELATSVQHCGACGNDCLARPNVTSATCSAGQCEFVCQIGFADCDGLEENGCEASLDEPTTCGSCTNDCTGVLANVARAACEAGACGIGECAVGWLDCDGSAANGCETNAFLVNSCGSCGPTNCYACGLDGCTDVVAVAGTLFSNTCAILADGSVWCWGSNSQGLLGLDSSVAQSAVPVRIDLPAAAVQVAGLNHLCALLGDGTVACWGSNGSGQLGDGTSISRGTPAVVPNLSGVVQIGAGVTYTCALTDQGEIYCWGVNWAGQFGVDPSQLPFSWTPMLVPGVSNVQKIAVGYDFVCALLSDGTVRCWGANTYGQVGIGTTSMWELPSDPGLTNVTDLGAGQFHACAILADTSLWCWGFNPYGQLGFPMSGPDPFTPTPSPVPGITGVAKVRAGLGHTCALLQSGNVTCWGWNGEGQIGDGTTGSSQFTSPFTVGLQGVTDLAAGFASTCAVVSPGTVHCWGQNDQGQAGQPSAGPNVATPTLVNFP